MKKVTRYTLMAIIFTFTLTLTANATTITDEDRILGLYGFQLKNEVPAESKFDEAISDTLPEIILEDDYFGNLGTTGFIFAANFWEEEATVISDVDYQENTINLYNSILTTQIWSTNWYIWYITYEFTGGTVLGDITRLFAEINYGEYPISEEVTRQSDTAPVPEPATMFLFGTGLTGLAIIRRRKTA